MRLQQPGRSFAQHRQGCRLERRPFDMIIVGGGSFGSVLASHLFSADTSRSHRITGAGGWALCISGACAESSTRFRRRAALERTLGGRSEAQISGLGFLFGRSLVVVGRLVATLYLIGTRRSGLAR